MLKVLRGIFNANKEPLFLSVAHENHLNLVKKKINMGGNHSISLLDK